MKNSAFLIALLVTLLFGLIITIDLHMTIIIVVSLIFLLLHFTKLEGGDEK